MAKKTNKTEPVETPVTETVTTEAAPAETPMTEQATEAAPVESPTADVVPVTEQAAEAVTTETAPVEASVTEAVTTEATSTETLPAETPDKPLVIAVETDKSDMEETKAEAHRIMQANNVKEVWCCPKKGYWFTREDYADDCAKKSGVVLKRIEWED